ncbi:hypothetical protein MBLNU230_g0379t1 [Neophaeotheca triangularis]
MADKLRNAQQLESLQNKFVGVGHSDTTNHDFASNIARDTYSSLVGHDPLLHYTALASGKPTETLRAEMMERMVLPVGPKPKEEVEGYDPAQDEEEEEEGAEVGGEAPKNGR